MLPRSKILCYTEKGGHNLIPETLDTEQLSEIEDYSSPPDKTYRLDFENHRIMGKLEDYDAVLQFIKKALRTDKYSYEIYDWYYGNELRDLVGMPYDYIITECPRIIEEALITDDRILSVEDFEFSKTSVDSMNMSCVVKTIYGNINYSQEVSI